MLAFYIVQKLQKAVKQEAGQSDERSTALVSKSAALNLFKTHKCKDLRCPHTFLICHVSGFLGGFPASPLALERFLKQFPQFQ